MNTRLMTEGEIHDMGDEILRRTLDAITVQLALAGQPPMTLAERETAQVGAAMAMNVVFHVFLEKGIIPR